MFKIRALQVCGAYLHVEPRFCCPQTACPTSRKRQLQQGNSPSTMLPVLYDPFFLPKQLRTIDFDPPRQVSLDHALRALSDDYGRNMTEVSTPSNIQGAWHTVNKNFRRSAQSPFSREQPLVEREWVMQVAKQAAVVLRQLAFFLSKVRDAVQRMALVERHLSEQDNNLAEYRVTRSKAEGAVAALQGRQVQTETHVSG